MAAVQDIAQLSDDELRQQLMGYGVNVGPIVSTTRLFYEKKLGKLIDSQGVLPHTETESEGDDYDEEEEEDEEVQINYTKSLLQSVTPPRGRPPPAEYVQPRQRPQSSTPSSFKPVIQRRTAEPTTPHTSKPAQGAPTQKSAPTGSKPKSSGGGVGMWIKLLFIVFVAGLIYLVIINMNPSAENKIPSMLDDPGV